MSCTIAHFSLWGDFAVDDITERLGIEPSCVYLKGDTSEGASSPASVSTWDLHCPLEMNGSPQEQLFALLTLLEPRSEMVKSLATEFCADLNLSSGGSGLLSLNPEIIKKLADLNLNMNFFFDCNEDDDAN